MCRALVSSGGGIRTRDLRVMSPTSYQTAPPRVAELHDSNSGGSRSTGAARRERRESRLMARVFVTRQTPRRRARPPGRRARRRRLARRHAAAARRPARGRGGAPRGCCRMLADTRRRRAAGRRPEPARDRQLRGRLRQHRPRRGGGARHPGRRHARTCSPTRPPTSPWRSCSRPRGRSSRPASDAARRRVAHVGAAGLARRRRPRRDARGRRRRAHRPGGGQAGRGLRHGGAAWSTSATTCTAALARADVVSLHIPLTPETRHLIDADGAARA